MMTDSQYILGDDYRDPKHGCLAVVVAIVAVLLLCLLFPSCKTVQGTSHSRDSIRVEVRLDSVYVFQHDSIFRDRWRAGDTVYVELTKYKTLYRDRLREVHDTIRVAQSDTITLSVPRPRTSYDRFCSGFFWVVLIIALLLGLWKAADYIPVLSGYKQTIKLLLRLK